MRDLRCSFIVFALLIVFNGKASTQRTITIDGTYFSISTSTRMRSTEGDEKALDSWEKIARPTLMKIKDALELEMQKIIQDSVFKKTIIAYNPKLPTADYLNYEKQKGACNKSIYFALSYRQLKEFFQKEKNKEKKNANFESEDFYSNISHVIITFSFSSIPEEEIKNRLQKAVETISPFMPINEE